jgi:hypothetical protein
MSQFVSAVVVGADRLGNIPDLLKGHNIAIRHHISGRDPSHQKKTLQLPSGTELLILLTDFLGHNVMKTFRAAAQKSGIRVLACRRSVCSMKQALDQCGYCEACSNPQAGRERPLAMAAPQVAAQGGARGGSAGRVRPR